MPTPAADFPWLAELPRDRWHAALAKIPAADFVWVIARSGLSEPDDLAAARTVLAELRQERFDAQREALARARRLPTPTVLEDPAERSQRQVNVRLTGADYARLRDAAHRNSMRSTTLARLLIVRGVNALMSETGE